MTLEILIFTLKEADRQEDTARAYYFSDNIERNIRPGFTALIPLLCHELRLRE